MCIEIHGPDGKIIFTDSTLPIQRILKSEGHEWFDIAHGGPLAVSEKAYEEISKLIDPG